MLSEHFELLMRRLRLTKAQRKDLEKKENGVAKCLHRAYYASEYNGSTRFLIGSVAKKTNIRPPRDIDILFKIPEKDYERFASYSENGQSALLQEVRSKLDATYPTTEKHGWVKVVTVEFSEGRHNVEVLPAYEREDGKFVIPNSKDGGKWEIYDARTEVEKIKSAHPHIKKFIKILKHWRDGVDSLKLSSYEIENFVLDFAEEYPVDTLGVSGETIEKFFVWFLEKCDENIRTHVETALNRANKANTLTAQNKKNDACMEWRKIFAEFPMYDIKLEQIAKLESKYPSEKEEFIEDRYLVELDSSINLRIMAKVVVRKVTGGTLEWQLDEYTRKFGPLKKFCSLKFLPISNAPCGTHFEWKVRNFGDEAQAANDLRGEIRTSESDGGIGENTEFCSDSHYVECYAIRDEICIAIARVMVPIGE